jgi:thiol-disulfide isomerase/thioredoxin
MAQKQTRPKAMPTSGRRVRSAATRAAARARRLKLVLVAAGAALLAAVALLAATSGGGRSGVTNPARFDLPGLAGPDRVQLVAYRGKPVVVNMFASWCDACQFELPGFARVADELRGEVTFIGVNSLETGNGLAMARQYHLDTAGFVLARDVGGAQASGLHDAIGAQGMPASIFYDAEGKVLDVERAALPESDLRRKLDHLYGFII